MTTAWNAQTAVFFVPGNSVGGNFLEQLSLYRSAGITDPVLVSFIGAGGKTSLLFKLAHELAAARKKTVITTTTKIYPPNDLPLVLFPVFDRAFTVLSEILKEHNLVVIGSEIGADKKLVGLETGHVDRIFRELNVFTLVEADGARGKPLKGHSEHEPLIPSASNLVFAVIGADALGKTVNEDTIHRVDEFCASVRLHPGTEIKSAVLARSFSAMQEIACKQSPSAKVQAILNKADVLANPATAALDLLDLLIAQNRHFEKLMLTAAADSNPVKILLNTSFNKPPVAVAAIILAAGSSKRMGKDKLNLIFGDSTVFETTLRSVLKAGAEQVIAVTRPGSNLSGLAAKYNCQVVENHNPERGLSSSLKTGLKAVDSSIQGALFVLADQPLVTTELYRLLINSYREKLKLVTCPIYMGKRGNPNIFDRRIWPLLENIEGDQGGRSLFGNLAKEDIDYFEVGDLSVVTDLDTPADYARLRKKDRY